MIKPRDMTQGRILRQLLLFATPLFLGNLLQQLYNSVDVIVVGNFIGQDALAAVGASGPLINMIIAFFIGISTGTSVLISQAFGARESDSMHRIMHTAITLSVIIGILLAAVGVLASPFLLRWMNTPEAVFQQATLYLRIYFTGLPALTVYNMGAAVLTAIGDSKRPLYFLLVTAVVNVTLNLLFVTQLEMGIAGVAWSTIIAEAVSAVLVLIVLWSPSGAVELRFHKLRIHRDVFHGVLTIGLPGAIQATIVSFSSILIQTHINGLGAATMAGYSASHKLDAFITLPVQTMALAVTTFVAQNLGAEQVKRARQGAKDALILGLSITVAISIVVILLGKQLLQIFSPDPVVIDHAMQFKRVLAPTYFLLCFTQIIPGALRGAGDVRIPTLISLLSLVVFRQVYLLVISRVCYTLTAVAISSPLSWLVAAAALSLYYRRSDWTRFSIPTDRSAVEVVTSGG